MVDFANTLKYLRFLQQLSLTTQSPGILRHSDWQMFTVRYGESCFLHLQFNERRMLPLRRSENIFLKSSTMVNFSAASSFSIMNPKRNFEYSANGIEQ
jgi:hypothetical protein